MEQGDIVLVGATTENPSFEVVGALLSRCRVVVLESLGPESLKQLLAGAPARDEALSQLDVEVTDSGLDALVHLSGGDARRALNLLELSLTDAAAQNLEQVDADTVSQVAQHKVLLYDKSGEEHFNLISALHKSLRDSDADAAVYWLVRMLESGEPASYIARRMVRFASEDVGLADPNAVRRALEGWDAYDRLGSPEGDLALVQVAIYLALAPKSNAAYMALKKVRKTLAERPADPVPMSIRNAPTRLMKDLGYNEGYVYAHDTEDGIGGLDCLPESLAGTRFYEPKAVGVETRFRDRLDELRRLRHEIQSRNGREDR